MELVQPASDYGIMLHRFDIDISKGIAMLNLV